MRKLYSKFHDAQTSTDGISKLESKWGVTQTEWNFHALAVRSSLFQTTISPLHTLSIQAPKNLFEPKGCFEIFSIASALRKSNSHFCLLDFRFLTLFQYFLPSNCFSLLFMIRRLFESLLKTQIIFGIRVSLHICHQCVLNFQECYLPPNFHFLHQIFPGGHHRCPFCQNFPLRAEIKFQ